jgi:HEAT repeat protein
VQAKSDPDRLAAIRAINALGDIGGGAAINALFAAGKHCQGEMLKAVIRNLGRIGGPEAVTDINRLVSDSGEDSTDPVFNEAFAAARKRERPLVGKEETDDSLPLSAIFEDKVLVEDDQKIPARNDASFPGGTQTEQMGAVKKLEEEANTKAINELIMTYCKSEYAGVRKESARVLGKLCATEAAEPLRSLAASDPDDGVRKAAKLALLLMEH